MLRILSEQDLHVNEEGLVLITSEDYHYLSWCSNQAHIVPPYFLNNTAMIPLLRLLSMIRHGTDLVAPKIPQFNSRTEHPSMKLFINQDIFGKLDKKVVWRQNGKEIRGTLSGFDPTEQVINASMVWNATLHDNNDRPWEFLVTFDQIANGSVEIEHDAEEDTKLDDSRSGCGKTDIVEEPSNDDGDMCD
jgi:small nuclear ribonucleoprotein (snRNP)-like protein